MRIFALFAFVTFSGFLSPHCSAQASQLPHHDPDIRGEGAHPSVLLNHQPTVVTLTGLYFSQAKIEVTGACSLVSYKVVSDGEIQMTLEGTLAIGQDSHCFFTVRNPYGSDHSWVIVDLTPDELAEQAAREEASAGAQLAAMADRTGKQWVIRYSNGTAPTYTAQGLSQDGTVDFQGTDGKTISMVANSTDNTLYIVDGRCMRAGHLQNGEVKAGASMGACNPPGSWTASMTGTTSTAPAESASVTPQPQPAATLQAPAQPLTTQSLTQLATQRPATLTLFSDTANNSQIVLDNVSYSSSGSCPSGQGSLSVQLFGQDFTSLAGTAPAVPFQNLCFDPSGRVAGGSITLPSDFSTASMFNGVGLILAKGTRLSVTGPGGLSLSGGLTLTLPIHDAQGKVAKVDLPGNSLILTSGADFSLHAKGLHLKDALADGEAQLGGFAFTLDSFDLDIVRSHGQTLQFLLVANHPQVQAPLPIPGLLTQDGKGVTLSAASVAVNKSGELQIKGGTAQNVHLELASPLAFTLQVRQVKFDKGFDSADRDVKTDCILTDTSVQLPATLPDSDTGGRITLQRAGDWDVTTTPVLELQADHNLDVGWNGFRVQIPQQTPMVLDFSASASDPLESANAQADWPGLPIAWLGLYARDVKFVLPAYFRTAASGSGAGPTPCDSDAASGSGDPVLIDARNLAIGNSGLSVTVSSTTQQQICIGGFQAKLTGAALTITNSHIDPQSLRIGASLTLPALAANTDWVMQLTDSGNFILSLTTPNLHVSTFTGSDIGGLDLAVSNATFELPSGGAPGTILLDGQMTLGRGSNVSDLAQGLVCDQSSSSGQNGNCLVLDFKGLGIDTNGRLIPPAAGQFTLAHPVAVDLDVLKVEVTNFTFGNDTCPTGNVPCPYILFGGGVQVGEGLPASAEVDFGGVKVASNGQVSLQGLELKADVADVVRVDASLQHLANGCHSDATHTIGCVKGGMKLGLNIGSLSTGSLDDGNGFTFEAAKGSWLLTGNFGLPNPGIALGNSGLALYGIKGGVGYKVEPANPQQDQYAQLGDANYIVYHNPSLPGDDLLFSLGVSFGTFADQGFTFFGDADFTVTTNPFSLDLNTRAKLQELRSTPYEQASRTAYADINFSGPDTLHATAGADLYYPLRSAHLVDAHGAMDFVLSPNEQHFFLGWPPDVNPVTVNVGLSGVQQYSFTGGLGVHWAGTALPVDNDPNCSGSNCAGQWFAVALSWHGDLGPMSADVNGAADVALDSQQPGTIDRFVGQVSAQGQADFGPFSASAEGMLAIAYLSAGQGVTLYPAGDDPQQVTAPQDRGGIYVDGQVEGCGSVFGKSVCKSIGISHEFD